MFKEVDASAEHTTGAIGKMGGALESMGKIAGGIVLGAGILKAPGFLMDAAKAAAEDEQSTARLNTTLRTLTDETGRLGPTFADLSGQVKGLIDSGQKLAFTDDEIRDSFGKLLDSTGNAAEATKRLAAAQDLARGHGIPLADATKLLGKLSDENIQIFKRLGITMADNATEADVLATVQAKFGGQAAAYAKSTAGQFEQVKIRMAEVKESIGYALLPILTKLGDVLVSKVMPFIESLTASATELAAAGWDKISGPLATIAGLAWDGLKVVGEFFKGLAEMAWDKIGGPLADFVGTLTGLVALDFSKGNIVQGIKDLGFAVGNLAYELGVPGPVIDDLLAKFERLVDMGARISGAATDTSNWPAAWDSVKEALSPIVDRLLPPLEHLLSDLKADVLALVAAHKEQAAAVADLVKSLEPLTPLLEPLAKVIGGALVLAIQGSLEAFRLLANFFTKEVIIGIEAVTLAIRGITKGIEFVTKAVQEWPPAIGQAFLAVWNTIKSNVELIKDLFTGWAEIGKGIVTGIWDGVENLVEWLKGKFSWLAGIMPGWLKKLLGIGSPSKLFAEQVGRPIPEGIAQGLDDGSITFTDALDRLFGPASTWWIGLNKTKEQVLAWWRETGSQIGAAAAGGIAGLGLPPDARIRTGGPGPGWNTIPDPGTGSPGWWGNQGQNNQIAQNPNLTMNPDDWMRFWSGQAPWLGPTFEQQAQMAGGGGGQTINLVVDGAVLASVVNRQNGLAY